VPTATDAKLLSFDGWTLRVHQPQAASPRLLVLLHGWTGDENSMWVFTKHLSSAYWMIAPRAPYPAEPSGFSWRNMQDAAFGWPNLETLSPAAEGLLKLIDGYSASVGVDAAQFDLMGFSQGAAMVNLLAMLHPNRIRKMAVLAGFVPSGLEELVAKKTLAGKKVFVAHGTQDQVIPLDRARASMSLLEQAGAQVTWCEDEVGHKLGANCRRALESYLLD
jgi:phospholipase/carboxylesterase